VAGPFGKNAREENITPGSHKELSFQNYMFLLNTGLCITCLAAK
jgi:hypothetical protein